MKILKSRVKIRSYKFMYWKYLHYVDEPCDDKPCDDEPCDDEPCDDEPCDDEPCDDEPCDDDGEERRMMKVFTSNFIFITFEHLYLFSFCLQQRKTVNRSWPFKKWSKHSSSDQPRKCSTRKWWISEQISSRKANAHRNSQMMFNTAT